MASASQHKKMNLKSLSGICENSQRTGNKINGTIVPKQMRLTTGRNEVAALPDLALSWPDAKTKAPASAGAKARRGVPRQNL